MCLWVLGFEAMIKFIYSGDQKIITSIQDLDLLFEIYRLADKVEYLTDPETLVVLILDTGK